MPLHQEPGSERSSSRTTGRTWPPTAPAPIFPRGLSCCSTSRCSSPATPPRAEQSPGRCPRPRPVTLHQEPGSERRSSRTRGAHLASDGPTCSTHGGSRAAPRPTAHAQRRCCARNKAEDDAPGRAQCRCTKNWGQRGEAAAPEGHRKDKMRTKLLGIFESVQRCSITDSRTVT